MVKKEKEYMIMGFYTDNSQIWYTSTSASNPKAAAKRAIQRIARDNDPDQVPGSEDLSNIEVVAVFEGHENQHRECLGLKEVTNGEDL